MLTVVRHGLCGTGSMFGILCIVQTRSFSFHDASMKMHGFVLLLTPPLCDVHVDLDVDKLQVATSLLDTGEHSKAVDHLEVATGEMRCP